MIHRHVGIEVINAEAVGDIVGADRHVVGWQALMGLVVDGDARLAVPGWGIKPSARAVSLMMRPPRTLA
jgi:hypothetical protein